MAVNFMCSGECEIDYPYPASNGTINNHWVDTTNDGRMVKSSDVTFGGVGGWKFPVGARGTVYGTGYSGLYVTYARFYFQLAGLPSIRNVLAYMGVGMSLSTCGLLVESNGKLRWYMSGVDTDVDTLQTGKLYGIEFQLSVAANPWTIDWRLWTAETGWVNKTQVTRATAASSITAYAPVTFYNNLENGGTGADVYFLSMLVGSSVTEDEDWSDSTPRHSVIKHFRVNQDLAHSFDTNEVLYEGSVAAVSTATDLWTHLDGPMNSQTTWLGIAFGYPNYDDQITFKFGTPADGDAPLRVATVKVQRLNSAGYDNWYEHLSVDDGANWYEAGGSWAETRADPTTHLVVYGLAPDGGAWTVEKFRKFAWRFSTESVWRLVAIAVEAEYLLPSAPPTGTFERTTLDLDPTAFWRLHEPSGSTAADWAPNNKPLTIGGTPTYGVTGWPKDGKALTLNGSNNYLSRAHDALFDVGTQDFSLGWTMKRLGAPAAVMGVIGHDGQGQAGEWAVALPTNPTQLRLRLDNTDFTLTHTAQLFDDEWHHSVIRFKRDGVAELVVDGLVVGSVSIASKSAVDLSNTRSVWVGATDTSANLLAATIGEVAFWRTLWLSIEAILKMVQSRNSTGMARMFIGSAL